MMRHAEQSVDSRGGVAAAAAAAVNHSPHPFQLPARPTVSQPLSKAVELPPQYRPRKSRKQVNVACQPCRKRRSKCSGTLPCSRCVAENSECVFDGRKDAQERNRELRNCEKALSRVFRVLKKLDSDGSTSSTTFAQIKQIARDSVDLTAFARHLSSTEEKTGTIDFTHYDNASRADNAFLKHEDKFRSSANWSNVEYDSTPQSSDTSRKSPPGSLSGDSVMTSGRQSPAYTNPYGRRTDSGLIPNFGNLPFSSAIMANGHPANIQQQQLQNLDTSSEYSMLPLHSFEQETLGRAYLSFKEVALQMIADGTSARQILGPPDFVNLDLFFRQRLPQDDHTISTFVCEIMKNLANPDVYAKLASIVLMGPLMRWVLFPTSEHYSKISPLMRPLPSQRFIPHSPALDLAPHPAIRSVLMSKFNTEWLTPENQITAAPIVNWNHGMDKTVYHDPVAGCLRFTRAFEEHVTNASNWTFSPRVLEVFPSVRDHGAIIVERQGE